MKSKLITKTLATFLLLISVLTSGLLYGDVEKDNIRAVQQVLKDCGFNPGPVDGIWGNKTTAAAKSFVQAHGGSPGAANHVILMVKVDAYRVGDSGPCPPDKAAENDETDTPKIVQANTNVVVTKLPDGTVMEGPIADGEPQGHFVITFPDGTVMEGAIGDGERQGHWIIKLADGTVKEGLFVNGVKQGQWKGTGYGRRHAYIDEGQYVNGKKHGQWTRAWSNGESVNGPFVNGKAHGQWTTISSDGTIDKTQYINGVAQ